MRVAWFSSLSGTFTSKYCASTPVTPRFGGILRTPSYVPGTRERSGVFGTWWGIWQTPLIGGMPCHGDIAGFVSILSRSEPEVRERPVTPRGGRVVKGETDEPALA